MIHESETHRAKHVKQSFGLPPINLLRYPDEVLNDEEGVL